MTRPALIGIGSHVIAALVEQLGAVPGLADAVELHLSPDMPGGRPRAAAEVLGRAVVVLAERGAMDPAERAALAPGCAVITLPRIEFTSLWPQSFDLAAGHTAEARAMFEREADCDIRVAAFVLSRFRTERLFHSTRYPSGPLLEQVMAQLLGHPAIQALATAPYDTLLSAVAPGLAAVFDDALVPVLPAVAAHFGLHWWSSEPPGQQGDAAEPCFALHQAAEIIRVAPFFATAIDPAIARHGAALLSAASARYTAPAVLLTALADAVVLGHGGDIGDNAAGGATRRIDAPAFLGFGPGWVDDPHGMTGLLPRLVAFARLRRGDAALVLLLPDALAQAGWLREMLALLGIGEAAVVWLANAPVACARLVMTSRFDRDHVSPFVHHAAQALASMVPLGPAGPKLLYQRSAAGGIANEEAVAACLAASGFTLVDADRTSLAERIALLRHASGIVGAQGPALAELAFCSRGAAVLELVGPTNPRMLYWSLASCAGLRYGYVVGERAGNGEYMVPIPMLAHAAGLMVQGS